MPGGKHEKMCGIAGILSADETAPGPELLERMIAAIRHRGPDGTGRVVNGRAGLAHARLSIIDIEGGGQPMANPDRTLWITFNGEIFNYIELREALGRKGHRFATRSDTEVILHLYEDEGDACVRHLNGQWAFALWDTRRQRLLLSRDRLGVRPLYYTRAGRDLVFASEVKALFTHPGVSREIDPSGLDQVFTFWTTVAPRTVFKDVLELPPGHSLVAEGGSLTVRRHWAPEYPALAGTNGRTDDDRVEETTALLLDATRIRLRSDVPVGAYLSGGLDSTLVTALIRRVSSAPLRTYSVGFDDAAYDETRHQLEAAAFLGTDHRPLHCSRRDIGRVFPDVVWHAEKPLVRTAPAPLYLLSRMVRDDGIKVVLTGEGADEMFGGYDIFKEVKIRQFWARQPSSRRRPLLLKRLYPYMDNLRAQPPAFVREFFRIRPDDLASPFFSHLPRWQMTAHVKRLFSRSLRAALEGYDAYADLAAALPAGFGEWDAFARAQCLEAGHLLPGYILSSQGDRVAMAHAVEGRFPFLDRHVVALAATLPPRLKMRVLREKHLLKRAAAGLIPPSIVARPKQPYRAPEAASFFAEGESPRALEYVESLLSPERLTRDGLFEPAPVVRLLEKVRSRQAVGVRDNMAFVAVLSTQLVVDQFVNHFGTRSSGASH